MTGVRIEFPADDPARFNALRDQWRGAAASRPLSRSAMRIATVLPTYVSREYGYAFPTDDDLRSDLNASRETIKRGLKDLEDANLIERSTRTKRHENGRTPGKERRIFLTTPMGHPKGQPASPPMGQEARSPMGQAPMGQAAPKGQKWLTDGSYGGPNIPDRTTPDSKIRSGDRKVSVYERPDPSVALHSVPSATVRSDRTVEGLSDRDPPHRNPYPTPPSWGTDEPFLAAFDAALLRITGGEDIGAGQIDRITGEAFDAATNSTTDFMPVHWKAICATRTDKYDIPAWFRWRASALIHRRAAA